MNFHMTSCGACRTCEIACSFHHTGEFKPSVSSIKIAERKDGQGCTIQLLNEDDGSRKACDACQGLEEPLCIQYCKEKDELRKIIAELFRRFNSRKIEKKAD